MSLLAIAIILCLILDSLAVAKHLRGCRIHWPVNIPFDTPLPKAEMNVDLQIYSVALQQGADRQISFDTDQNHE